MLAKRFSSGLLGEVLNYLIRDKWFVVSFAMLSMIIFAVLSAPLWILDPYALDMGSKLQGPSPSHPAGTDQFGRDIFSRVIFGGRISLFVAFSSILLALALGIMLGVLASYKSGHVDTLIMRGADVVFAFPSIVLGIAIMAALGPNVFNIVATISIVSIPHTVRVVRSVAITEQKKLYVLAEKSMGAKDSRILFYHLIPNILPPIIVQGTLLLASAILIEAALGFLGVGIAPPEPSWGGMLNDGRSYIISGEWWMTVFPGLAISIAVFLLNLIGDSLRDALDPKIRRRRIPL